MFDNNIAAAAVTAIFTPKAHADDVDIVGTYHHYLMYMTVTMMMMMMMIRVQVSSV